MINSKTDLTAASHLKALSRSYPNGYSITYSKGASLIEVLVALIIFSIGILGIVGLQLSAANNSQINNHFIQIQLITGNLSSRIKLNKGTVVTSQSSQPLSTPGEYLSAQSYDLSLYGSCQGSHYQCFCQQAPAQIPTCRLTSCTPAQLAQFDTYEVACMLALISNSAAIKIYPKAINTDTLLLSINLVWPAQSLFTFSAVNSDCQQAMQDLGISNKPYMCYSQSLVITATYYDS